jgi:hypothetical protein
VIPEKHLKHILQDNGEIITKIIPVPQDHIVNHIIGGKPGRLIFAFDNLSCITFGGNSRSRVHNNPEMRGVYYRNDANYASRVKKWCGHIRIGNKRLSRYFKTEEEARVWRKKKEREASNDIDGVYENL